jgi:hypothetical protein
MTDYKIPVNMTEIGIAEYPHRAYVAHDCSSRRRNRMKTFLLTSLVAAAIAIPSFQSTAQQRPGTACRADREKFCPDTKPGDGKYAACMKEHASELSQDCSEALQAAQDSRRAIRMNCKADVDKFCADAKDGKGGVMKCLRAHEGELGQACADAMKAGPGPKNG